MTPEQAAHLKTLITAMKEKQLEAFGGNANMVKYTAWIDSTAAVEDYINSITVR